MIKTILGVICAATLLIGFAYARPMSTSPDPKAGAEMTGTIKEYAPGSTLVLQTLAPTEPVQFKLSKNVTYADTDGKAIKEKKKPFSSFFVFLLSRPPRGVFSVLFPPPHKFFSPLRRGRRL